MEFAPETASRRCEIVRLGPPHVKDGQIRIERAKGSKDVDIPLPANSRRRSTRCPGRSLSSR
jgi:hypothetical protein